MYGSHRDSTHLSEFAIHKQKPTNAVEVPLATIQVVLCHVFDKKSPMKKQQTRKTVVLCMGLLMG